MNEGSATNTLRLGRFLKEYKSSAGGVARIIVAATFSVGIAGLFFLGAVSEANSRAWGGMIALSIIGLIFMVPVLVAVYVLFRGRGASLRLFENGLNFRRGGKESSTTWEEIDSYMQETACRITKKDGEVIEFGSGIENADEVAETIQAKTLEIMLPKVRAAIKNGSRVQFKAWKPAHNFPLGKRLSNYMEAGSGFDIDSSGITDNDTGKHIAWKDIRDFGISEETRGPRLKIPVQVLYIANSNQQFRTRYGLLANAHVLLALCSEIVSPAHTEGVANSNEAQ